VPEPSHPVVPGTPNAGLERGARPCFCGASCRAHIFALARGRLSWTLGTRAAALANVATAAPFEFQGRVSGRTGSGLSCCLLLGKVHSEELPYRVHLLRARHQGRQGRYRERRSVSDAARLAIMCGLPKGGRCRVRIYLPEDVRDAPVVVCSERPSNPGGSITNSAEVIAAGVIRANELPIPQVWVEHWPEETTEGRRPSSWLFSLATRSRRRRPT
jgi:hypothetical protein